MKAILVSLFLAFSLRVTAQKESAFFVRLHQAEELLESQPEKAYEKLSRLERDTSSYSKEQKRALFLAISKHYKNDYDLDRERSYLLKCLSFGTPPKIRCDLYYKLAANAAYRDEYSEELAYLTNIFRVEKYADPLVLAKAEILIGSTYINIGEYKLAEKYLLRAIESNSRLKTKSLMHAYLNLGILKHKIKQHAHALHYFLKAQEFVSGDDLPSIGTIKTSIGAIYVELKQYDKAEAYIREALEIVTATGDENNERSCVNSMATIFRDRGSHRQALDYYLKALSMEKRLGSKEARKTILLNISEMYEDLGNMAASLDYYKQYTDLKDELFDEEKMQTTVDIREKYEASKRQKEIAEMKITKQQDETEKLNMRYAILIGGILVILAAVLAFGFFRIKTLRTRNAARLALISASLDAEERERLRISQELHDDLGGILGMSRMLFSNTKKILRPQAEELYDRIDQLLVLANSRSRAISHELFSPTLKTFGLVKALNEHFDHLRFGNVGLELELEADPELKPEKQLELNLFRISQELLNNTLKYAEASKITLNIEIRNGFLYYTYSDNGKGVDMNQLKKGVGLNSIDSRVQRFLGQSSVKSSPGKGFELNIKIPLKD